jgi:branched-subunit amino acid aminotransferase/4-amino-4-deoxychorismate lyase
VASAQELMAINVVRGVVPVVDLASRPIANGQPGVWALRLRSLFDSK